MKKYLEPWFKSYASWDDMPLYIRIFSVVAVAITVYLFLDMQGGITFETLAMRWLEILILIPLIAWYLRESWGKRKRRNN